MIFLRKRIFVDTVSTNKNYAVDTVSTNKNYAIDTVSTNKKYAVQTLNALCTQSFALKLHFNLKVHIVLKLHFALKCPAALALKCGSYIAWVNLGRRLEQVGPNIGPVSFVENW